MAHPMGAGSRGDFRLDFDRSVRLELRGSQLSSDGGLLLMRELDEALGSRPPYPRPVKAVTAHIF